MDEKEITKAYPLYWPEGWPRTEDYKRKRARFDDRVKEKDEEV